MLEPLIHLHQLNLAGNRLEDVNWLQQLPAALNHLALRIDLSSNHLRSINISFLVQFQHVNLADNRWDCTWLTRFMLRTPPAALNFERSWPMLSAWNDDLLNVRGVDCFDGHENRSIILIDVSAASLPESQCDCEVGLKISNDNPNFRLSSILPQPIGDDLSPLTPPLTWPKIRTDRFDSRSVIIWMLVAIALAFAGLRWGQRFMDRKEISQNFDNNNGKSMEVREMKNCMCR